MIKKIYVKNYILIDELNLEFTDGLNVITGETGSGKSILINAIDFVFGAKINKDLIKKGEDKAIIELTISNSHDLSKFYDECGVENWGNELVISKEISPNSSRSRVNGTLVNQEVIKMLKEIFLDIHSQHQTYSYLQPSYHVNLLDAYAKDFYGEDLNSYQNLWNEYQLTMKQLNEALKLNNMTESQIDFLKFQIDEISSANITDENEDSFLHSELTILANSEKLKEHTNAAYWALNEDDNSCINSLLKVRANLSKVVDFDENLNELHSQVIEQLDLLKTLASELNSYASKLEFDKEKIDLIQERIYLLDKLKRKYGPTLADVLKTYENLVNEFENIEVSTQNIEELTLKLEKQKAALSASALKLTDKRKDISKKLSDIIVSELEVLELPKSRFEISLEPCELNINGAEKVEFLISTNVSQEVKPLIKVASGGEISRVMLAIKSIFANHDDIDTVIFDEIDTGISGKASISVAEKISNLANYRQIILITHQPIIASKANNHIYVSKKQSDVTTIEIKPLVDEEKLNALAELASGEVNQNSLDFVRSLIK